MKKKIYELNGVFCEKAINIYKAIYVLKAFS